MTRIGLTEEADVRAEALVKGKEGMFLRVAINGGGCGGYQYDFDITEKTERDLMVSDCVITDPISAKYMDGAIIDYVDEVKGSYFKVDNPLAQSTCGCGESFSVKE